MTTKCDACGTTTVPDMVVAAWLRHYNNPAHWIDIVWLCRPCAIIKGWQDDPLPAEIEPCLATRDQLDQWLQFTSR
jgi:hypothetical protein